MQEIEKLEIIDSEFATREWKDSIIYYVICKTLAKN